MRSLQGPAALVARLFLAYLFVVEGWAMIGDYQGTSDYMAANGVPALLLPFVILTELGGGLLVGAGLLTRPAAAGLAGFCLLTAIFFHSDFADTGQFIHFGKNMAMAGGFMSLMAYGPGPWSLDALLLRARPFSHSGWFRK